ncbi:MAG: hypothetical protein JOZ46_07915 [Candidatus Dormibacteraeota bacterium]|nr:hypothetical protein [Candidatus Dormibacteraeota bacterium]MBV9525723.1 hypothetical protein [Candidatus Dormibacteraeota bacterium]
MSEVREQHDLSIPLVSGYATLRRAAGILAAYGVNLDAVCVAGGSADCHLLVRDGDQARALLERHGITVAAVRRVHALRVPNRPGTLARVLELLVPVEDSLAFIYQATDRGLVLGANDPEALLHALAPMLRESDAA